jgi:hypothetical protein
VSYHVHTHDWPTGGKRLEPETVRRVLADFDRHHAGAVRALAETTMPDVARRAAGEGGER